MSFILFILLFTIKFQIQLFISKERNPRLGTYVVTGHNISTITLFILIFIELY